MTGTMGWRTVVTPVWSMLRAVARRQQAHRVQRRVAALRRPHAVGGEALEQLDVVVALGDRVLQVVDLHVLVEVDEGLVVGVREDRPRGGRACLRLLGRRGGLGPCVEAGGAGRLPAGAAAFRQRRVEAEGARHPAGGEDARRQVRDGRPVARAVVGEGGARLAQQRRRRRIAAADDQQVAAEGIDGRRADTVRLDPRDADAGEPGSLALGHGLPRRRRGVDRHPARRQGVAHRGALRVHAQVHHRGHLDARVQQVEGGAVAFVVHRRHHRAAAGLHAVELDQALRGRAQHDARQVVVAEDQRLLQRAGGDHHRLGPELVEAVAPHQGQPVVGVPAEARGPGHRRDAIGGLHRADEPGALLFGADAAGVGAAVEQPSAEGTAFSSTRMTSAPASAACARRREPGRAAAHHQHVAEEILLVEIAVRGGGIDAAEAGDAADHPGPERPRPARLVERLVVEADGEEAVQQAEHREAVVPERPPVVLAHDLEVGRQRHALGEAVGRGPTCTSAFASRPESEWMPRGRWYLKERDSTETSFAASALATVSPR